LGGQRHAGQEGAHRTAIGRDEVEGYGYQAIDAWRDVPQGEILQEQNIGSQQALVAGESVCVPGVDRRTIDAD
jgi:hypothetical protein